MDICEFCKKPLEDGDFVGNRHTVCIDELVRRANDYICSRCGKNEIPFCKVYCNDCNFNSQYRNFAGPQ